jgi:hypothetical protein
MPSSLLIWYFWMRLQRRPSVSFIFPSAMSSPNYNSDHKRLNLQTFWTDVYNWHAFLLDNSKSSAEDIHALNSVVRFPGLMK